MGTSSSPISVVIVDFVVALVFVVAVVLLPMRALLELSWGLLAILASVSAALDLRAFDEVLASVLKCGCDRRLVKELNVPEVFGDLSDWVPDRVGVLNVSELGEVFNEVI